MGGMGVDGGKGRLEKWETYAEATLSQDNRVLTDGVYVTTQVHTKKKKNVL